MRYRSIRGGILLLILLYSFFGCAQSVTPEAEEEEVVIGAELPPDYFVVVEVNDIEHTIRLQYVNTEKQITYGYSGSTYVLSQYEENLTMTQLSRGEIVEIKPNATGASIERIQIVDKVWKYKGLEDFSIDLENRVFSIGKEKYWIREGTLICDEQNSIALSEISEKDVLSVWGNEREIYSIFIEKGHGFLVFEEPENFYGGWVSVDNVVAQKIEEDMRIELTEGTYQLTATNNGYRAMKEIEIIKRETLTVNLNEIKDQEPKSGMITFTVQPEGAVMHMNGAVVDYTSPIQMEYGVHRIKVACEGFATWAKKIVVNSATATIEVILEGSSE